MTNLPQSLAEDIRFAFRMMRHNLGLTTMAVLSLALGIGATIAIFSVLYALALRPLPVRQPDRLVEVAQAGQVGGGNMHMYAEWKLFGDWQHIFSDVFAFNYVDTDFNIRSGQQQQEVSGLYVSGGYFQTLGVPAFIGRVLQPSDDRLGAPPVCVLGYGLWRQLFGQSRNIIGRTILVNGNEFQIVGVAPRSFFGVIIGFRPEIFMTLEAERTYKDYQLVYGKQTPSLDSRYGLLGFFARLKPGESVSQANAGLKVLSPQIDRALPPRSTGSTGPSAPPGPLVAHPMNSASDAWLQDMDTVLLLMTMAAVALIIACANLGNLLLARAAKRQGEIATRLALGATRGRLVRQLLTESAALSVAGAAAGLVIAYWGERILLWALSWPDMPLRLDLVWDTRLVVFAMSMTLACTLLFGLAPAMRATEVSLYSAMKSGLAAGKRRNRVSNSVLVVVQVALSVAVLVSAGLLARTVHAFLAANLGYDPKGMLVGEAKWQGRGETSQSQAFVGQELLTRFRSLPGVTSASWIRESSRTTLSQLTAVGQEGTERRSGSYPLFVSPDFFKTRRAPNPAGRDFNDGDTGGSFPVAILSETLAKRLFQGMNPVGRTFEENDSDIKGQNYTVEVVGVAKDIQFGKPNYAPLPILYRPVSQCADSCSSTFDYEMRAAGSLPEMTKRLAKESANVDPLVVFECGPFDPLSDSIHRNRAMAVIAATFGLFVGLLAMIGVYGVTSYATAERTHEIGIRIALGAQQGNVLRMILGETIRVVCVGIALGVGAGIAAARLIGGLIWGVKPTDPLSFGFAICLMLLIGGIAALLPARRATKIDPMVALRYE